MARELEAVARCAARCRESIQYSSSPPRGVNLGRLLLLWLFSKCLLGSSAIFMTTDNKEQRVCLKFCFLLGKSAAETVLMLQEAFKDFFLFSRMKGQMKGKRFAGVSEVKKKTLEVLNNISTEEFQKYLQPWEQRWHKCIESKGEYFEGD